MMAKLRYKKKDCESVIPDFANFSQTYNHGILMTSSVSVNQISLSSLGPIKKKQDIWGVWISCGLDARMRVAAPTNSA